MVVVVVQLLLVYTSTSSVVVLLCVVLCPSCKENVFSVRVGCMKNLARNVCVVLIDLLVLLLLPLGTWLFVGSVVPYPSLVLDDDTLIVWWNFYSKVQLFLSTKLLCTFSTCSSSKNIFSGRNEGQKREYIVVLGSARSLCSLLVFIIIIIIRGS